MAKNNKTTITREEALTWNADPMIPALERERITPTYWAKKLKAELNAKETKVFHNKDITPRAENCPKCNGTGELIDFFGDIKRCPLCKGSGMYEISPVIYSKPMVAWEIRQKARQDLARYMGFEPKQKWEIGGEDGAPIPIQFVKTKQNGSGKTTD